MKKEIKTHQILIKLIAKHTKKYADLTMSRIAVCLMFQRHNLYTIKLKSLAAIKSVTKTFRN